ncbi:NnrU family protein [Gellertiella hungarica]|uniref:Putative membrane protein n=1 Tax=Gellertiella hungarica TaxID=1572859 RepID=A0A7W6NLB5_9HYPH|nr:NnrU family protein [Gellertiella hungarica]MBB4065394.1 putative membrane protein [Gellertiella hungarica]
MPLFLASLALFIALHSIPAISPIRSALIGALGRGIYFGLYSAVSTLSLGLVFWSAFRLDYVPLWDPAPWQADVTLATAPVGLFLVIAGLLSRNPLSVTLRRGGEARDAIVSITRHPVLVGFLVWALGHLPPNGDLRSVILFSTFSLFSLAGIALQERRTRRRLGPRGFAALTAGTTIIPLLGVFHRGRRGEGAALIDAPLLAGLAIAVISTFLLLAGGHEMAIGVDPLALANAG